jgi:hypothetical protein
MGARLVVDRTGGNTRLDEVGQLVEDFRGQSPGLAHAFEASFAVQLDRAVAIDGLIRLDYLIFGHAAHIGGCGRNCERTSALR